jgi:hypothetical protein
MSDLIARLIPLCIGCSIAAGVALLLREIQRQALHPQIPTPTASSPAHHRLLTLLNGDRRTAERLLIHTRRTHPDKPQSWHYEKIIYDLERDRH